MNICKENVFFIDTCPQCGHRQHPKFIDVSGLIYTVKCKKCGCVFEHRQKTPKEIYESRKPYNKEFFKAYYQTEKYKKYKAEYREAHREQCRGYNRKWRAKKKSEAIANGTYAPKDRRVAICDKITMEVLEVYKSVKYATLYEGKSAEDIYYSCRKKTVPNGRIVYRYMKDIDNNESFKGKMNRPVAAFDVENGDTIYFYSMKEAAEYFYMTDGGLRSTINKNVLCMGKYRVSYAR